MIISPLVFDAVILTLCLISAFYGMMEGFIHQLSSLLSWFIGFVLAWRFSGLIVPYLEPFIPSPILYLWLARGLILIAAAFLLSFIGRSLSYAVRRSPMRYPDRFLGFFLGAARAFVILYAAYLLASLFSSPATWSPSIVRTHTFSIIDSFARSYTVSFPFLDSDVPIDSINDLIDLHQVPDGHS